MNMKKHLTMMLCLIGMAASMNAQSISGKLVDEKNEPLTYANVVLLSMPDSTFVSGTISDEMGGFQLSKDEKGQLIRISSIGYATVYKKVNGGDFGVIQMTSDAQLLGEVTVKGTLPTTRLKGDAMITGVTGTVLEQAGTAEMLLDKIPNVSARDGAVKVFGRGTPVIYINGRKVRDNAELDQLASDNIKSVEVINNPGARYDASVKAVIRIITKKAKGEGFGFNNRLSTHHRRYGWTTYDQFNFNYRKGGFDLTGMLSGGHYNNSQSAVTTVDIHSKNHYKVVNDLGDQ
ncbi:MAG: carboxypeptidase-like regulatory domain-containing protein, partial [Bacteroidaceae bacterium]|nr:carboxypeptidase-like regulatory domain-containing protein [Bacteroidaceae bacterium]